MDRIRKALDLARQEREGPFDSAPEKPRPQASKQSTRLPAKIQYTNTRMFAPSAELLESNRIIAHHGVTNPDAAAAAFRMLRTQVLQRLDENAWRSLALMSPGSEDGKTTTAINLAVSLANDHHHTVLLVDFDLKKPMIAKMLGIEAQVGTEEILRGNARVEDCLFYPEGFNRLVVLPAMAPMAHSSEALSGPRCRELVAELRGRYPERILLFDLPPILSADDALSFVPLVECVLMVIAEGATRREDLLRAMELLRNVPVVGTVLNRANSVASAYG
jgi:Mrp family chromosome partitioning ATPase